VLQYREFTIAPQTVFSEKCYNALHLDKSRPHDREWTLWIACYNALTAEDPDPRQISVDSIDNENKKIVLEVCFYDIPTY
jgi:hypothetical protein